MNIGEVTKITDELAAITKDSSKIPPIGDRLKLGGALDTEHRDSLLELAEKYNIPGTDRLKEVLAKEELTERDCKDALDITEKILLYFEKAAHRYVEIKIWLASFLPLTDIFDSTEDMEEWMKDNIEKIKKFKTLESAIKEYRAFLNRPIE